MPVGLMYGHSDSSCYSLRKANIGSVFAARRAGMKQVINATIASNSMFSDY
jgi:hypothetical protein